MPFLSNWPLLKRLALAPFRRSLTISIYLVPSGIEINDQASILNGIVYMVIAIPCVSEDANRGGRVEFIRNALLSELRCEALVGHQLIAISFSKVLDLFSIIQRPQRIILTITEPPQQTRPDDGPIPGVATDDDFEIEDDLDLEDDDEE